MPLQRISLVAAGILAVATGCMRWRPMASDNRQDLPHQLTVIALRSRRASAVKPAGQRGEVVSRAARSADCGTHARRREQPG